MSSTAFQPAGLPTFAEIDHYISNLDSHALKALNAKTLHDAPADRVTKAVIIYRALRPLIVLGAAFPMKNSWRIVVQMFIVALDEMSADSASGEFKAGKDL